MKASLLAVLLVLSVLVFLGAADKPSDQPTARYQLLHAPGVPMDGLSTVFKLDVVTGKTWRYFRSSGSNYLEGFLEVPAFSTEAAPKAPAH